MYERLKVKEAQEEKKPAIDTHAIIMDALRILASTGEQFNAIAEKVNLNHEIFQSEKKTLKDTILRFLRNIFGLEEPPVSYDIFITDKRKIHRIIRKQTFVQAGKKLGFGSKSGRVRIHVIRMK